MKGFVHVIEIIIVMLAMFVIVFQLVATPAVDTDWSTVSLSMRASDMLYALDASGINWFNAEAVNKAISGTLNESNLLFSVQLDNVIKPDMKVGCICFKSGEFDAVKNALSSPTFSINGQNPNFRIANITTDDMPLDYDVIIVMDHNISYTNAYNFLSKGKGLVEIRDLNVGLAGGNAGVMGDVHQRLFGIMFDNMVQTSQAETGFTDTSSRPSDTYFNIYKYFYSIPNGTGDKINATHKFSNFLDNDEKINITEQYSARAEPILVQASTGAYALVANRGMVENKGRTVWMSGGMQLSNDDAGVLLKSLVIWASGESYALLPSISMVNPVKATMYKVFNNEMMQPVEISLTMGNIY